MAWFDQNSGFIESNDMGVDQTKITRQKELAKAMLEKGMTTPLQGQMVSGHYVKPGFLQYLNQIGNTLVGSYNQDKADGDQKALNERALQAYMKAMNPDTETVSYVTDPVAPQEEKASPSTRALTEALMNSQPSNKLVEPPIDSPIPLGQQTQTGWPTKELNPAIQANVNAPEAQVQSQDGAPYDPRLKEAILKQQGLDAQAIANTPIPQTREVRTPIDPEAIKQKQLYNLINLSQVQGPMGDMARMQLTNIAKTKNDYDMVVGKDGTAFMYNKSTGQYKKVDGTAAAPDKGEIKTDASGYLMRVIGDKASYIVGPDGKPTKDFAIVEAEAKLQDKESQKDLHKTERQQDLAIKTSADRSQITTELSTANSTIGHLENLKQMLTSGTIKTGPLMGLAAKGSRYVPGLDSKKVDAANVIFRQLEAGGIQSMKGLGSMSNIDFAAMQKRLPNWSNDTDANIAQIDSIISDLKKAQQIGSSRLNEYDSIVNGGGSQQSGVAGYGQTYKGPSSAPVVQQQKQSTGGASFKW